MAFDSLNTVNAFLSREAGGLRVAAINERNLALQERRRRQAVVQQALQDKYRRDEIKSQQETAKRKRDQALIGMAGGAILGGVGGAVAAPALGINAALGGFLGAGSGANIGGGIASGDAGAVGQGISQIGTTIASSPAVQVDTIGARAELLDDLNTTRVNQGRSPLDISRNFSPRFRPRTWGEWADLGQFN